MKFINKILSLLIMILMTSLVLIGCNAEANKENSKETSTSNKEENSETSKSVDKIIVFQSKVEITDQLEACAKEYEKETGIEVEVWGTTGDDYLQQLKTKLTNDQGPTVFSLAPGSESEQLSGYLADLGDLSFINNIADKMADEIEGKIVGIPYTVEGFGVVYNKNLIDSSKINSTEAFIDMLKEQKESEINGFSLSQESYFLIGHILNTPFALQEDPKGYIDKLINGEVTMNNSKEFVDFANLMVAIRENTENPLEVNYDKQTGDFATEKVASIHQGNWCYPMFKDYDINFEMAMMPLPISGNDKLAVSVPTCWYVNSQVSEDEIKAGKDFINWLYTSETGTRYLMEEFGFIPVVSTIENDKLDPLSQEVSRFAAEGKTISWPMSYWPAGIVDVYLVPVAQEFFTTDMTADEFLTKLTNAFVEAGKK